jgi:hypothetical protein
MRLLSGTLLSTLREVMAEEGRCHKGLGGDQEQGKVTLLLRWLDL